MAAVYPPAARADARARIHQARSSASMSSLGSSGANGDEIGGVLHLAQGDEDVGQNVHGVAQRCHFELDRHRPQLLDRPRAAGVAPPHIGDGLAPPLHEGRIERVLQHGGVAVVVLGGEDHVPVGAVDDPAEAGDRLVGVVTPGPYGRVGIEERQRVVPQIHQLRDRTRSCSCNRPMTQAATRSLNRPSRVVPLMTCKSMRASCSLSRGGTVIPPGRR